MLIQISEDLGHDKNMNAMVFSIEKKRVARNPDADVVPDSQADEEMETTSQERVNALRVILVNTCANLSAMIRPGVKIESTQTAYAAREISQVETAVQSYNAAGAPYASSKNQMFKQRLSEQATRTAPSCWTNTGRAHKTDNQHCEKYGKQRR